MIGTYLALILFAILGMGVVLLELWLTRGSAAPAPHTSLAVAPLPANLRAGAVLDIDGERMVVAQNALMGAETVVIERRG